MTHLAQIARHNPALNAIVALDEAGARQRASKADAALAAGEVWGALHSLPVTIKDAFETAGLRTTSGYAPLAGYIPQQDATVVARLRAAGAIVLGKTNMPPLAFGFQTDGPLLGRANNPWDTNLAPGGAVSRVMYPAEVDEPQERRDGERSPSHGARTQGRP